MGDPLVNQPLQGDVNCWTLHQSRVRSSGGPATPLEVHWWTSHSRGCPLVDQPLQAMTTGGPSTIPGWSPRVEQLPNGRPIGGPAAPGEVRLWSTHIRGDSSIVQQLQGWPSGRSIRQTLRPPCSQATSLEAYCWTSRSRGGPRVYATPRWRPTRGPSTPECPLVDQPLQWLPTGGPATPGIAN